MGKIMIRIEKLQQEFIEDTAELHTKLFGDVGASIVGFKQMLKDPSYEILVACTKSGVSGYAVFYVQPKQLYWNWFGVSPESQSTGIGERILQEVIEYAKALELRYIELDTRNRFVSALRFYIKRGFKIIGTHLNLDGDIFSL